MYNFADDFSFDLYNDYYDEEKNLENLSIRITAFGLSLLVCVTILFLKMERNKIIINTDSNEVKDEEV